MGFLFAKKELIQKFLKENAIILDVRNPGEFKKVKLDGSLNIPLAELNDEMSQLDKSRPIITCCAMGVRSELAKDKLKKNGFEVINGGSWRHLKKFVV